MTDPHIWCRLKMQPVLFQRYGSYCGPYYQGLKQASPNSFEKHVFNLRKVVFAQENINMQKHQFIRNML